MARANTERVYEDFQALSDWKREDKSDFFVLSLPGFKKEQLKIQLDCMGKMKISAERPIDGNKWSRLTKNFYVPEYCNQNTINARFENGILHVTMPKKDPQTGTQA